MEKFTYTSKVDKKGNVSRYRCWFETFKDEDSGETIKLKRHELIKYNGEPVRFYGLSELKKMNKQQLASIKLKSK